jgi:transposase
LLASDGPTAEAIAAAVGESLLTVRRWRRRHTLKVLDGLLNYASRPSAQKLSPERMRIVLDALRKYSHIIPRSWEAWHSPQTL